MTSCADDGDSEGDESEPDIEGESCSFYIDGYRRCEGDGIRWCGASGRWSECFTEPCAESDETRTCTADGTPGMQHCVFRKLKNDDDFYYWGRCITDPVCTLGDERPCMNMNGQEQCWLGDAGDPYWFAYCP
jgi:hypothetical protein